jgi:hypothetical protein
MMIGKIANPDDQRLPMSAEPYGYIGTLLEEETAVIEAYEAHTGSSGFGLLKGWAVFRFWKNAQLLSMLDTTKIEREIQDDTYREMPRLAAWTRVSLVAWSFIWTAFGALTLADLHVVLFYPGAQQYSQAIGEPFKVGDFWGNLPGRLVAVTFALTCVTYYVNNFALIAPRLCGKRFAESVMRGCAWFLPLPVLWALIYDPRAWPLCSGIGTVLVVVNNYLALGITKEAEELGARFSTRGTEGRLFVLENFEEWWKLMGAYSLSLIVIGVLLLLNGAKDEKVYAALVVAVNVFKMYRLNCVKLAPKVRGNLLRDIFTISRAQRLDSHPIREPASASPRTEVGAIDPASGHFIGA